MLRSKLLAVAALAGCVACGENGDSGPDDDSEITADAGDPGGRGGEANGGSAGSDPEPSAGGAGDEGACNTTTASQPIEGAVHVPRCTVVSYESNPPSSGDHYPNWAAFGVYDFPLPRGFWVHNLEHGAIVVSYNCPDGCEADLAEVREWFSALVADDSCLLQGQPSPRALLVPDPLLPSRFAASAWGHILTSNCFDAEAFTAFYADHVAQGPEDVCSAGVELRNPDGTPISLLPADCGQ